LVCANFLSGFIKNPYHCDKKGNMSKFTITGTVQKVAIGTGFWGIVDQNGNNYRPINMPAQLKLPGKSITITAEKVEDGPSIFMWGTPIKILSFST